MPRSVIDVAERSGLIFRLLLVVLVAVAVAVRGGTVPPALIGLAAGYLVFAVVLWLLAPRLIAAWPGYPIAVVDVAATTAAIALLPGAFSPGLVLYLLVLAAAALRGRGPLVVCGILSVAAWLGVTWLAARAAEPTALWPALVLAIAAGLLAAVLDRSDRDRDEARAWREIAAARADLLGKEEPDPVATVVVEHARSLLNADWGALWWSGDDDRLRPGFRCGELPASVAELNVLSPTVAARLERGSASLEALDLVREAESGVALGLRQGEDWLALLAVGWNRAPRAAARHEERLQVYGEWAREVLAHASDRAAARETLRRERVLREAAGAFVATLEPAAVQAIAVKAAATGLEASVSLVERSSGRVVGGGADAVASLVRQAINSEVTAWHAAGPGPRLTAGRAQVAAISDELALVATRSDEPLVEVDARWLAELAELARVGLDRCAEHGRLEREEQRLRSTLEALPAPVGLWDADGMLVFANAVYHELGLSDAPPSRLLPMEGLEEEVSIGDPPRVFIAISIPLDDGAYIVSLYREITREREALQAKDELIAMVGHELRNPLAAIHGYSQMMTHQLGIVQSQVDRLNQLIGDFLDAARLGGGQLPLNARKVNLTEVVVAAADRFRGAHGGRWLNLQLDDEVVVEGDPSRLGQVIDNLLGNAAKYSGKDQEITVTVRTEGNQALLSVQDRGVGIPPEHLARLFERFYRVPGPQTARVKGLGLGLSIVRDLVTAHGGRVWAESAGAGQGTTFWVSLPAAVLDVVAAAPASHERGDET